DPDAEDRLLAALLYPHASESLGDLRALAAGLSPADRAAAFRELAATRLNRRDKPPRALENVSYTFDIVANLGAYRDLQRHRLLTQERQDFTTAHGYDLPPEIEGAGFTNEFRARMDEAGELYERIHRDLPKEAQYVVPFAFRTRWYFHLNLREAVHLCELRSM